MAGRGSLRPEIVTGCQSQCEGSLLPPSPNSGSYSDRSKGAVLDPALWEGRSVECRRSDRSLVLETVHEALEVLLRRLFRLEGVTPFVVAGYSVGGARRWGGHHSPSGRDPPVRVDETLHGRLFHPFLLRWSCEG